jgi:hypothetical protein
MESTTTQSNWLQDAIKKGIILGIIHIVFFLILYVALPSKITGISYLFAVIVINIGYTIYQGIQYRKEIGGFMSYGAGFKYVFVLMTVNGLVGLIFTMVFVMVVPDFPEFMADSQLNTTLYWTQKFGAPESALDEVREKYNPEDVTKRFTIGGQLMGFGIVLIFYVITAVISAIFVKKNQPVEF